ncbi:Gfo/Idh/MocA family oxidoreductase [Nitratireductor pacificus]|uniref:Oxidoreductase-like protein n=1 Tax=Nitratireductor pacificus pht-3B TaxID=391937 RepID=K2MJI1_9HYPH|nr:Gfo/Idh/MocA family oxidoreductase [Nitratireductor pacificus]EKF20870.1 oxidoreductase-like protein [Nitratireductor pacificus pht-3B]
MVRIAIVGEGAIADTHMQSLSRIAGAEVVALVHGEAMAGAAFAEKWNIAATSPHLDAVLERDDIDAVIVASPSALHPEHATRALDAGKHVLAEIPIGLDLAACEALAAFAGARPRQVAMAAHTRRFSPAHRHLKARIDNGSFALQHLVAETFFFRRTNLNMHGEPRSWVDNLLWHHACHTIDLFIWLTGDPEPRAFGQAGPLHPELGIPMDMSIALKAAGGPLLSLALSFNNRGPFGGFYRYIGDSGTFHVFRDALEDHERQPIRLPGAAFLDQDQAFIDAINGARPAQSTIGDVLPAMRAIHRIDTLIQS